jgi:glucose-6-phosphate isomerase
MSQLTQSAAWLALAAHRDEIAETRLQSLFNDEERFTNFSLVEDDLLLDFSKNRVTATTMKLLRAFAEQEGVEDAISAMFAGERINHTEGRAVFHVALRNRSGRPMTMDGHDVMPDVLNVLERMNRISTSIRDGSWLGHTGEAIRDVVNIGIGGSDLGPAMVCQALAPDSRGGPRLHFVSNIDGAHIASTLERLDPATTLFVVASKTFTTDETLTNARTARAWLVDGLGDPSCVARHFVAVSTNADEVTSFGIDRQNMLEFWDWVGGRFSLWSAVGLSIACAIGMSGFEELLAGAHAADEHFRSTPLSRNIPVTMALLGLWSSNFLGAESHAILPYDQSLARFAAYFQQGDMESNGKGIDRNGASITDYRTGPIVWGEPGTNGQHAFFQLLHQGTRSVAIDFIAPMRSRYPIGDHHRRLLANFMAQSEALMCGKDEEQVRYELEELGLSKPRVAELTPHKCFPGDRPSTSILFEELTPRALGRLIALYEHKIFVQGVLWRINSFDQWGVELGKQLAVRLLAELEDDSPLAGHDSSTRGLVQHYKAWRSDLPAAVAARRKSTRDDAGD